MLKLFQGVYRELMLILYQRASSFGLGIMSWQDTEQELLWQFLVETRDYAFANFFKGQSGMPEKKYFF
jgi:hypothetical protein